MLFIRMIDVTKGVSFQALMRLLFSKPISSERSKALLITIGSPWEFWHSEVQQVSNRIKMLMTFFFFFLKPCFGGI